MVAMIIEALTSPGVQSVNILRPEQNGGHFAEAIFKYIYILINILLKRAFEVPINNTPA